MINDLAVEQRTRLLAFAYNLSVIYVIFTCDARLRRKGWSSGTFFCLKRNKLLDNERVTWNVKQANLYRALRILPNEYTFECKTLIAILRALETLIELQVRTSKRVLWENIIAGNCLPVSKSLSILSIKNYPSLRLFNKRRIMRFVLQVMFVWNHCLSAWWSNCIKLKTSFWNNDVKCT